MSFTAMASAAANGPETPSKKKKKPSIEPTSIPFLPEDLIVSCLARVSRLYYPTLSLVSKQFRSLLASPEIYQIRFLIGRTESCLYVCLRFESDYNLRWFTLYRKPDQTLTSHTSKKEKEKSSGYLLVPIYDKSKELTGDVVELDTILSLSFTCTIENITYYCNCNGEFVWSDHIGADWRKLEGLEGLPKIFGDSIVKLAEYGGNMVILWDKYVPSSGCKENVIWCAQIALERRNPKEIWGKVEWLDEVLTVPGSYEFVCATSATV